MSHDPKADAKAFFAEIDQRLTGVFGELGRALGAALQTLDEGGEVTRSETIATSKGPVRAEAGLRVRVGGHEFQTESGRADDNASDPRPVNRPAAYQAASGAAAASAPPPARRDISATIVRDAGHWSLSAELPGITAEDVTFELADGVLKIEAEAGDRAYAGSFEVPDGLDREALVMVIRNGILDLTAPIEAGSAAGERP